MAGVVKHVMVAKFKDEIPPQRVDELIARYTELAALKPVKSFHWGKNVSKDNLNQGFTHVFEATFDSCEGVAEYVSHPAHAEIANLFVPALDKYLVIDYKPITVKP